MSTTLDPEVAVATPADTTRAGHFYRVVWRWHFYAGLFVVPFMLLLAITGIIYLFKPQLDRAMYGSFMQVVPQGTALPPNSQLAAVAAAYPDATLSTFYPPESPSHSGAVKLATAAERDLLVWVNPYTGQVLGQRDEYWNLQNIAMTLHGELMAGSVGDYLVELAACWALVLMVTGLYMWWPRSGAGVWGTLLPRLGSSNRRLFWRDLHTVPGFWGSLLIVFMLLSGLPWAGFWGTSFARISSQYPAGLWDNVPLSTKLTGSLNSTGEKVVPWAAEQLPMPQSALPQGHAGHEGHMTEGGMPAMVTEGIAPGTPVDLDSVVALAQDRGLVPGFSVSLPADQQGVYTAAIFPDDPRQQATLHIDQYSGKVLADIRFADYALVPQVVETGIALHEGKMFGLFNQIVMLLVCLLIITLAVSGTAMWWLRRPAGRLGAPAMPKNFALWKGAVAIMALLGLLFPLMGASLVAVLLLDYLLLSRVAPLKRVLG